MNTDLDRLNQRPRLWTCPTCSSRWYMAECPLDGAIRPPAPPPPPPDERPLVDSKEKVEGRFIFPGSAVVLSNEYEEWIEVVTHRQEEQDEILLVTATGRPILVGRTELVRVSARTARMVGRALERGWYT